MAEDVYHRLAAAAVVEVGDFGRGECFTPSGSLVDHAVPRAPGGRVGVASAAACRKADDLGVIEVHQDRRAVVGVDEVVPSSGSEGGVVSSGLVADAELAAVGEELEGA